MTENSWPLYEVFVRGKRGLNRMWSRLRRTIYSNFRLHIGCGAKRFLPVAPRKTPRTSTIRLSMMSILGTYQACEASLQQEGHGIIANAQTTAPELVKDAQTMVAELPTCHGANSSAELRELVCITWACEVIHATTRPLRGQGEQLSLLPSLVQRRDQLRRELFGELLSNCFWGGTRLVVYVASLREAHSRYRNAIRTATTEEEKAHAEAILRFANHAARLQFDQTVAASTVGTQGGILLEEFPGYSLADEYAI